MPMLTWALRAGAVEGTRVGEAVWPALPGDARSCRVEMVWACCGQGAARAPPGGWAEDPCRGGGLSPDASAPFPPAAG